MKEKLCKSCGVPRMAENTYVDTRGYLHNLCRKCQYKRNKQWESENLDAVRKWRREYQREYRKKKK